MAHRLERRAVRRAGHAARAGVRALSLAALVLTLGADGARATPPPDAGPEDLRDAALPGVLAWWAEPGRPGATSTAWLVPAFATELAGLTAGGIAWSDGTRGAPHGPWPALAPDQRPLVWADTVAVDLLPTPGPEGALAQVRASRALPADRHARASFGYVSGDDGVEETVLLAERGDARHGLLYEVTGASRDGVGSLGRAGRHRWGLAGHTTRGASLFTASYAQHGSSDELALGEVLESARGESGQLGWLWGRRTLHASLTLVRTRETRESGGPILDYSRRDASEDRVDGTFGGRAGDTEIDGTIAWRRGRVVRSWSEAFDRRSDMVLGTVRAARPAGDGRLEATLGLARASAVGGWQAAPGLAYRFSGSGVSGGASLARLTVPVWSDVAAGQEAFLQRTWAGGLEAAAGGGAAQARLALLGGVTHDRALVDRWPIAELWLRDGLRREAGRTPFALALGSVAWDVGHVEAGAEGYALTRRDGATASEPSHGFRGHAGVRFKAFQGDLDVHARLELEGVGGCVVDGAPDLAVPGYVSAGATLALRISDATMTIRARNLEDRARPQSWYDPEIQAAGVGPGRQIRFALTWALSD